MMDGAVHVMHARPVMTAGLAALLHSARWRVTGHHEQPEAMASADIVVTGYEDGLELARTAAPGRRARRILVVTQRDKASDVRRAMASCVAGYLPETTDAAQLHHAVRFLFDGKRYFCPSMLAYLRDSLPGQRLTGREIDVLQLLAQGWCNKRIARGLGIGVSTVKWHVHGLMVKLGASARTEAVVMAAQRGLVGLDAPAQTAPTNVAM